METYEPHKNTTEVRQGSKRTMNFRVLVISILVLIALFAAIWAFYAMMPEGNVIS